MSVKPKISNVTFKLIRRLFKRASKLEKILFKAEVHMFQTLPVSGKNNFGAKQKRILMRPDKEVDDPFFTDLPDENRRKKHMLH